MFQKGEERREGAFVSDQRKPLLLVVDANADRPVPGVVGQREEDVLLPAVADEEAAQRRLPQHTVGVLHSERTPVEPAALELGRRICNDVTVLLAGEGGEVGEVHAGNGDGPLGGIWGHSLLKAIQLYGAGDGGGLVPGQLRR